MPINTLADAVNLFQAGMVTPDEIDFAHQMNPLQGFTGGNMTPGEYLLKNMGRTLNGSAGPVASPSLANQIPQSLIPGRVITPMSGYAYNAPQLTPKTLIPQDFASRGVPNIGAGVTAEANSLAGQAASAASRGNPVSGGASAAGSATSNLQKFKNFMKGGGKVGISGAADAVEGGSKGLLEGGVKGLLKGGLKSGIKGGLVGVGVNALADQVIPTEEGTGGDFLKKLAIGAGTGAAFGGVPGAIVGGGLSIGAWLLDKALGDDEKQAINETASDPAEEAILQLTALGEKTGTDPRLLDQIVGRYYAQISTIDPELDDEAIDAEFETYRQEALDNLAEVAGYREEYDSSQYPPMTAADVNLMTDAAAKWMAPYFDSVRGNPLAMQTLMTSTQAIPYAIMMERNKANQSSSPVKTPRLSDFTNNN